MRTGLVLAFTIFYTCFIQPSFAQQQIFKNYTVNDGLISNSIRRIFQDSKGFLWIATWEGLSKYDGHSFNNFTTANGLSHNLVNDVQENKEGNLLIFLNNKTIDVIKNNQVFRSAIYTSATINLLTTSGTHYPILTTDGEGLQELRNEKIVRPSQSFPHRNYYDVVWLNDSLFIAAGDGFVGLFDKSYTLLSETKIDDFATTPTKIFKDSRNHVWIGTSKGIRLSKLSATSNLPPTLVSLPSSVNTSALKGKRINAIFEDASGNIWVGTNAGLIKISDDGTQQTITVKDGIASNIINCIFQDKEENMWFGTAVGLSKLVTRSGIALYGVENGIFSSDNLFLLYPYKKDHLLVSTNDGVKVFQKSTGNFSNLANGGNELFYNLIEDSHPPLLIGINKMVRLDTIRDEYFPIKSIGSTESSRIISDHQGNYFCSNLQQLFFYSGTGMQTILNYRISSLLIDKNGNLWAATWQNGLFRITYRIKNSRLEIIAREHYLASESIRTLMEDTKGNIWAGTRYNGVYRLLKNKSDHFTILNINQTAGLSSNFIKGIKEDGKGNFWVAFYQGLDKLIPDKNAFRIFNFSRVNNYFTSIVGLYADADKSLWLATGEGLTHINDGELEKTPPLPVYITKVQYGDSSFTPSQQILELKHHQKQLAFEFSSPGFINEKQVMYSYRLVENAAGDWSAASNQHAVSYANLQPGSYLFEVRALGWNAQWGTHASFSFNISPAWWQTWWFRLMLLVLISLLTFLLLRRRIKSIRHEAEMKQKIAETEMMALRAQMNPHFIFNCLTSIDNLIQLDEKEKATLYLSKFAKLIRAILENSGHNTVPCWKDMETMQLYLELEALRFDNKFSYQIIIAPEILNGDYKVPPLIVQPYVENAIHHGLLNKLEGDKRLRLEVLATANHINYLIEDNGIGRKLASSYKQQNKLAYGSMGMQITEERINLFNQRQNGSVTIEDLYDENNQPNGTRVNVSVIVQP